MMNDNITEFKETAFRTKRIGNDYNKQSNERIILNFDIDKTETKENDLNNENIISNNIKNNTDFIFKYKDLFDLNDNEIKNYKNFQSFLKLTPKEGVEIPTIKYYNFSFNIGTPAN